MVNVSGKTYLFDSCFYDRVPDVAFENREEAYHSYHLEKALFVPSFHQEKGVSMNTTVFLVQSLS